MKKCILFIGLITIYTSCRPVIKLFYGVKMPQYETKETLNVFANSIEIPKSINCSIKPESWIKSLSTLSTDVFIFSQDGNYIPYKDSLRPNCNGPAELFVTELRKETKYYYSDEYTLESFLNILNCDYILGSEEKKPDFYIFMTWAKFAGRQLYREKTKIWLDSLQNNKNISYQLFMINQDLQDSWSVEEKEKLGLDYKH